MNFNSFVTNCSTCLQADIDPIFKMLEICLNESSSFFGARRFQNFPEHEFPEFWDMENKRFKDAPVFSDAFQIAFGILKSINKGSPGHKNP